MSDCWVVGSGPVAAGCPAVAADDGGGSGGAAAADAADAFGEAEDASDGLKTPPRPEAPWTPGGTAEGVNGIEGGWMITPFIPSGRVWSNAPVPRKEWTIMVSDRILAGYPAFSALFFILFIFSNGQSFFFFFEEKTIKLTETPRALPPR